MKIKELLLGLGFFAISQSVQAQSTWYEVTVPSQEKLNDIQFIGAQTGYIAGDNLTLLKSTDGGQTWVDAMPQGLPSQGPQTDILDIEFVSSIIGYAVIASQGNIYKTTDGGSNWSLVQNNQTNQCFPYTVHAFADDDLFTGGSDCFQGMTINQYQNNMWSNQAISAQTFNTSEYVVDLDFAGNLGLAAVNNEYILRSVDFGATWDTINTNIGNGNVHTSVMVANGDTCYAGYNQNGGGFGILYSTDAGLTWQEDINSATFYYPAYYGATMDANGKVFMAAVPSNIATGLIFEQNGAGWWYVDVDHPVYAMDTYGSNLTWAVGDSGYVVVNQDLSTASISEATLDEILVYPNPAEDVLTIAVSSQEINNLTIIDVNGKVVRSIQLIQEKTISIADLQPGIYAIHCDNGNAITSQRFVKY